MEPYLFRHTDAGCAAQWGWMEASLAGPVPAMGISRVLVHLTSCEKCFSNSDAWNGFHQVQKAVVVRPAGDSEQ